jgi:ABC-type sulfate transport system substrate-binding protein
MQGIGVSTFNPKQELYPLVSGEDVARSPAEKDNARYTFLCSWKFSQEKKEKEKKRKSN